MKRERVEDLGVIKEKLGKLLENFDFFEDCQSKHTIDTFCEKYNDIRNLENLHNEIRWMIENLWEIYGVAVGNEHDNTD